MIAPVTKSHDRLSRPPSPPDRTPIDPFKGALSGTLGTKSHDPMGLGSFGSEVLGFRSRVSGLL